MDQGELVMRFQKEIILILSGLAILGLGIFAYYYQQDISQTGIEIVEDQASGGEQLTVELAGAVNNPGVYTFTSDNRVNDALSAAGGLSEEADLDWVERFINRAELLKDGQKIFIPKVGEENVGVVAGVNNLININTASQSELESLWGIGPVYAQKIIEHRPYSAVEELLKKEVIKENVYEQNFDRLSVY